MKPWREPDVSGPGDYAIWYGPEGREGDCALEVEGPYVRQYQSVIGYLDNHDGPPILCTETYLEDCPEDIRLRAALGVARLAESGGEESFVEELP